MEQEISANYLDPEASKGIQMDSFEQEKEELNHEEIKEGGTPNLNQHYKRCPKKDKKKCWNCRAPGHLKKHCPFLRCFNCSKLGHLKENCQKRKIDFVFNRMKELYKEQLKKKQKKSIKQKQKELEEKIIRYRALYMDTFLKETDKGQKYFLKWKNVELGEYIGSGLPQTVIENFKKDRYDFKNLNVLVKKFSPIKSITLYKGFSNWCACDEICQGVDVFTDHVVRHHKGIIPMNSQLNRPFWQDWNLYNNDFIEEDFCYFYLN